MKFELLVFHVFLLGVSNRPAGYVSRRSRSEIEATKEICSLRLRDSASRQQLLPGFQLVVHGRDVHADARSAAGIAGV